MHSIDPIPLMAIQTVVRTPWSNAVAYQKRPGKTPKTSKNQELRGLWLRRRRFRSAAAESTPGAGMGDKHRGDGCDREDRGSHRTLQAPGWLLLRAYVLSFIMF